MPAVSNIIKAVVEGTVGADTWSWGFWIQCDTAYNTNADLVSTVNAWDTAMKALSPTSYSQLAQLMSTDSRITQVTMYYYDSSDDPAQFQASKQVGVNGASNSFLPLQNAIVVTLNTQYSGARFRGRCYLCANGTPATTGHLIAQGVADQAAAAAVGVMASASTAVRAHGGGDASRVVVRSLRAGLTEDVVSVSVDTRPDVQRRRADKQRGVRTQYTGPNP